MAMKLLGETFLLELKNNNSDAKVKNTFKIYTCDSRYAYRTTHKIWIS